MNTTHIGKAAETAAAAYLTHAGFVIVERNFKTPRCEIDIIARKSNCTYFVEVKYRSGSGQGTGIEYITLAKQRQMRYAAETWIAEREWVGDVALSALEVDRALKVTVFIEDIS